MEDIKQFIDRVRKVSICFEINWNFLDDSNAYFDFETKLYHEELIKLKENAQLEFLLLPQEAKQPIIKKIESLKASTKNAIIELFLLRSIKSESASFKDIFWILNDNGFYVNEKILNPHEKHKFNESYYRYCKFFTGFISDPELQGELEFREDLLTQIIENLEHKIVEKAISNEIPVLNETNRDKVSRLLSPLLQIGSTGKVIAEQKFYDTLVDSYTNWIEGNKLPGYAKRFQFNGTNKEFYSVLKNLHKELNLKINGVGDMLIFHLFTNNKKSEPITGSTIEKNIKTSYSYKD